MNQHQLYWKAHRNISDANITFLEMVKDGLTSNELSKLIVKRPALWKRFDSWISKLPN
jgi:hypothetical protein